MKLRIAFLLCSSVIFCCRAYASFPVEMTENANSIVQLYQITVDCNSMTTATIKYHKIVTVLNPKGNDASYFICHSDKFSSLSHFKGQIIDTVGNVLRKIKMSDLKMTEYSQNLAEDSYRHYYECHVPCYPYTVIYEWEENRGKGILEFPVMSPLNSFNQSLMKGEYSISVPKEMGLSYKEVNIPPVVNITRSDGKITATAIISSIKAVEKEPFSPGWFKLMPVIFFSPNNFIYGGYQGEKKSWDSYAKWMCGLINGRDILTESQKHKVHELTDTCMSERSKVKVLYDYLGETTRYVGIQLGIGGLQPMEAEKVAGYGFGDCKGLTNYLKSMLMEAGINSNYTIIGTDHKDMLPGYTSIALMNHVILKVPLENDTLWLECTNPKVPFGYVHEAIEGHEALVINGDGGKIERLPSYESSLNKHIIKSCVHLKPTCAADIDINEQEFLRKYNDSYSFADRPQNEQIEILRRNISLIDSEIKDIKTTLVKDMIPEMKTDYTVSTGQYGKRTGNRMFITSNIFRCRRAKYDCKNRKNNICISGSQFCDTIIINIPDGYAIEAMPRPVKISELFGEFSADYTVKDGFIYIEQSFYLKEGEYAPSINDAFANLYNGAVKAYNDKIVLKKI